MTDNLNLNGWIYVCIDISHLNQCKIGLTKREDIYARVTGNRKPKLPFSKRLQIPQAFIDADGDRAWVEKFLHVEVNRLLGGSRQNHIMTGNRSEWFSANIADVLSLTNFFFARCVDRLDEGGDPQIDDLIFDPILDLFSVQYLVSNFSEENYYVALILKYLEANPSILHFKLTDTISIPYYT